MTIKENKITRQLLLWGLVGLLVAVGGGLAVWPSLGGRLDQTFRWSTPANPSQGALETLAVYGQVPEFSLIERSGRQITLADQRRS
jgi:hypothetical protein